MGVCTPSSSVMAEVSEHEERRGILYPHIPIFIYTDHGSRSHLRGKDFMQFGFVILGVDGLNKTLMRGQLYLYFTEGTFPPAALVIELNTFTISSTFALLREVSYTLWH